MNNRRMGETSTALQLSKEKLQEKLSTMNNTTDKPDKFLHELAEKKLMDGLLRQEEVDSIMDDAYERGINDAIAIVGEAYLGFDGEVMLKGKYTNDVFMSMLSQLKKKLKSQPEKGTDPPPLTILPPLQ